MYSWVAATGSMRRQHELPLGVSGQHARLVVARDGLAPVREAGPVPDPQAAHERSPTQVGAALVGKYRWRIASDAALVASWTTSI
jgi:hypothetical protein